MGALKRADWREERHRRVPAHATVGMICAEEMDRSLPCAYIMTPQW
jgi:hypothetical protein